MHYFACLLMMEISTFLAQIQNQNLELVYHLLCIGIIIINVA